MEKELKKAVTYRCFAILMSFLVALLLTGSVEFSLWFIIGELILKSIGYYIFEKVWKKKDEK